MCEVWAMGNAGKGGAQIKIMGQIRCSQPCVPSAPSQPKPAKGRDRGASATVLRTPYMDGGYCEAVVGAK